MRTIELIAKKRDGRKLSKFEIQYLIDGYCRDYIPDYQISALLMAIYLKGMNAEETACLTKAMLLSGERFRFKEVSPKVDKHSTGGVGDKISLILAPLVACCGIAVPMLSGRGLMHSGGTLDKLESIPGFSSDLTAEAFHQQLHSLGVVMAGQTARLVPADKKLYALRDATATVASIPLITSSILSKKLAEDIDALVLDIKCGVGAFMQTLEEAKNLAAGLISTAERHHLPTTALITNMDQPLGYAVGNWLEVREAINCLQNKGPADIMEIVYALAAHMLVMAKQAENTSRAKEILDKKIRSGEAWEKFLNMVQSQNGETRYLRDASLYETARYEKKLYAPQQGFVTRIDAMKIGMSVVYLGGGRAVKEESINYKAGIQLNVKVGSQVEKNDLIMTLYSDAPISENIINGVMAAFEIKQKPAAATTLILETLSTKNLL